MKRKTMIAAIAGVMFGVLSAGAAMYQDYDTIGVKLNKDGSPKSYVGWFNISDGSVETTTITSPYTPTVKTDIANYNIFGTDTIASADVYFYLRDDNNDTAAETVNIRLSPFWNNGNLQEFTDLGVFGASANISVLAELETWGSIKYTVTATSGDFYFDYAGLEVNNPVNPSATPDAGASVTLLGLAILSLGVLRRKLSI